VLALHLAFIDHYDSFSFNLIAWLEAAGVSVEYHCYDEPQLHASLAAAPKPLVFSPGPKSPIEMAASCELIRSMYGHVPILGICLGHQLLGHFAGADIAPAEAALHGACRDISHHAKEKIFSSLPATVQMAAYNSLAVKTLPAKSPWRVIAWSAGGEIEGIAAEPAPLCPAIGLQFHPESFLSQQGPIIAKNWADMVAAWWANR